MSRKLDEEQVRKIKRALKYEDEHRAVLATRFGVRKKTIQSIAKGRSWGWVTV